MKIVLSVKNFFNEIDQTHKEVAEKIGTTQSNLSRKLRNNSLYSKDIENIAKAYGYDVEIRFIKKE